MASSVSAASEPKDRTWKADVVANVFIDNESFVPDSKLSFPNLPAFFLRLRLGTPEGTNLTTIFSPINEGSQTHTSSRSGQRGVSQIRRYLRICNKIKSE